jgi:hypothetical protein
MGSVLGVRLAARPLVDGVTADSAKLHLRALAILKEQGRADDYTVDEYMLAVERAAA